MDYKFNIYYVLSSDEDGVVKTTCWFNSYYFNKSTLRKLFIVADNVNVKLKITYNPKYGCQSECVMLTEKLELSLL